MSIDSLTCIFSQLFPYLLVQSVSRLPLSYSYFVLLQNDHFHYCDGGGNFFPSESGSRLQNRVVLGEVMTRSSLFNRAFDAEQELLPQINLLCSTQRDWNDIRTCRTVTIWKVHRNGIEPKKSTPGGQ